MPLGGYIRMIGMFPPRPGDQPGTVRASSTGRFSQLVDEARAASLEEVRPGDERRVFYRLPVHQKVVVMLGGPTMNLLIGVVLLTLLVTVHGVATAQPGAVVASVSQCVVPVTKAGDATTCTDQPKTPALAAGILPGDRFVSIAGQPVDDTTDVGDADPAPGRRGGPHRGRARWHAVTVTATPIRNIVPVLDDKGVPVTDADGTTQTTEAGFLGVRSSAPVAYEPQPVTAVPGMLWGYVSGTAQALVHVPQRMVGVWQAAFGGAEREVDSPMSVVGVGRVAGEATGGKYDSLVGKSVGDKLWFLVGLIAALNFMLFLFNLSHCCRSTADTWPAPCGKAPSAGSPSCAAAPTRLRRRRQGAADRLHRVQRAARLSVAADLRRPRQTRQPRRADPRRR